LKSNVDILLKIKELQRKIETMAGFGKNNLSRSYSFTPRNHLNSIGDSTTALISSNYNTLNNFSSVFGKTPVLRPLSKAPSPKKNQMYSLIKKQRQDLIRRNSANDTELNTKITGNDEKTTTNENFLTVTEHRRCNSATDEIVVDENNNNNDNNNDNNINNVDDDSSQRLSQIENALVMLTQKLDLILADKKL
jgi:hypothetical protein